MVAKKVVALVLASAVCLTAFSGCGNSASDNSQSTVSSETAGESESAKEENNEKDSYFIGNDFNAVLHCFSVHRMR